MTLDFFNQGYDTLIRVVGKPKFAEFGEVDVAMGDVKTEESEDGLRSDG